MDAREASAPIGESHCHLLIALQGFYLSLKKEIREQDWDEIVNEMKIRNDTAAEMGLGITKYLTQIARQNAIKIQV